MGRDTSAATPGAGSAACADVAWPPLDSLVILGHPGAHPLNLNLSATGPSGLTGNAISMDQVQPLSQIDGFFTKWVGSAKDVAVSRS